jgi:hypothetical protein
MNSLDDDGQRSFIGWGCFTQQDAGVYHSIPALDWLMKLGGLIKTDNAVDDVHRSPCLNTGIT